eukprot:3716007-Rhodomonas_salina.2
MGRSVEGVGCKSAWRVGGCFTAVQLQCEPLARTTKLHSLLESYVHLSPVLAFLSKQRQLPARRGAVQQKWGIHKIPVRVFRSLGFRSRGVHDVRDFQLKVARCLLAQPLEEAHQH